MKNMSGFLPVYGILIIIAFLSLGTIGYGIQSRAQELIYYNELSKQKTVKADGIILCGGPNSTSCEKGFECKTKNSSKKVYGVCEVSTVQ